MANAASVGTSFANLNTDAGSFGHGQADKPRGFETGSWKIPKKVGIRYGIATELRLQVPAGHVTSNPTDLDGTSVMQRSDHGTRKIRRFSGSIGPVAGESALATPLDVDKLKSPESFWNGSSDRDGEVTSRLGGATDATHHMFDGYGTGPRELNLHALEFEVMRGACPAEISGPMIHLIQEVRKLRNQVDPR